MQETILQFGTGNFLRGFADDFMQQLNNKGLYAGQVVVVSPTDSATVEKINAQGGRYHLLLRGLAKGQPVRDLREIRCISRVPGQADPAAVRPVSGPFARAGDSGLRVDRQ